MDLLLLLLLMLGLLLLKGFFSGSEIALVNADKVKLNASANQGHRGARLVLKLFGTPDVLLGTTLVGTNICTVALSTLGAVLMIEHFGDHGELYAFLVFTPMLLIFGEIVPKSVYQQTSDRIAPIIVYPLRAFSVLLYPIVFVFSRVARFAALLVGAGRSEQTVFMTREQLRSIVDMAERTSNIDAFDRGRIRRVIRFAETTVGEAMIPVAEITAISRKRSTVEAVALVRRFGYNRLPVFEENISDVVGVVTLSTWDLMSDEVRDTSLQSLMSDALYVSPYQTIDELLPVLRTRPDHMAVVVDEFGSAIGMITMEDIIEEVVGEIDVGYDFDEYLPKRRRVYEMLDEEVYLMDSRLPISEVSEALGVHLDHKEGHTIGGLVMARLRHIPVAGEEIVESGYRFTVESANERTVLKLRVEPAHFERHRPEPGGAMDDTGSADDVRNR